MRLGIPSGFSVGLFLACLVIVAGGGCASPSPRDRPAAALQLQKSVVLSAGRYAVILKEMDKGRLDEAKDSLDWWIDMAIIELQLLEEQYPQGDWENAQFQGLPPTARVFYKQLAQFRRDHPRRHSVPLDRESLRRIDLFVQKYQ